MRRALLLASLLAAGCTTLGPDYERPETETPEAFRGLEGAPAPTEGQLTLGDLEWSAVFRDPVLRDLIEQGLESNYDVQIAAERVLAARSRLTIVRADMYPDVALSGGGQFTRDTKNGPQELPPGVDKDNELAFLSADLAWEIDFWGRVERATEAARADLLATDMSRRAVAQSLVAALAEAYYVLLELDEQLVISQRTLESRERSLRLVSLRLEQGVANKVELRQAEGLVITAAGNVPRIERDREQVENLIRELLGQNPGPVPRGRPLREQERTVDVPEGLPSEVLARRPDVVIAEQQLVAANAQIGAARALLYPTIALTGTGGVASEKLSDLFKHDSLTWNVSPSATLPIFNAGRLEANVQVSESQQREAVLQYQQTVRGAFREVADALIGREKASEIRDYRQQYETALADQTRLSNKRYRGGVTSYLEVLDSERDYFDAELGLAQAVRDELLSIVFLYRALGGGWQGTPAAQRYEPAMEDDERGVPQPLMPAAEAPTTAND
jgi:multidrug efflux system outer membrane protein